MPPDVTAGGRVVVVVGGDFGGCGARVVVVPGAAADDDGAVVEGAADGVADGVDVVRPVACAAPEELEMPVALLVVDAPEADGAVPAGLAPDAATVDDGDGVPDEAAPADAPAPGADDPVAEDAPVPAPDEDGAVVCRRTWPGRAADTTPASQATAAVDPMVATEVTRRSRARPCARRVTPSGMPGPPPPPLDPCPHISADPR